MKRAQSETVGFVLIILIVMVVGVVFLGISIRNKPNVVVSSDAELANFLSASVKYTTDCARSYEADYRSLEDSIADCYSNAVCLDSRSSCFVLNKTYSEMLQNLRPGGKELSYYKLAFYYTLNSSEDVDRSNEFTSSIISGNSSQCGSKRASRNYVSVSSGTIIQELSVCLAS
jgi:hypothetical protein